MHIIKENNFKDKSSYRIQILQIEYKNVKKAFLTNFEII